MTVRERVEALRGQMAAEGVDACLVPSSDAHMGEYVGEHWKSRRWITGFTGSAGTAVITRGDAGLWTDGRYYIQAEKQLEGSGIRLFRAGQPDVPSFEEWLGETLSDGMCLAFDGRVVPVAGARRLGAAFRGKKIRLRTDLDLVGRVWADRPPIPADPAFLHELRFAGRSFGEKAAQLREKMRRRGADTLLLTALDDICWLFNIRGADVPYNPFVTSFALLSLTDAQLFIRPDKVPEPVAAALGKEGVALRGYDEIGAALGALPDGAALLLDPEKTSVSLRDAVAGGARVLEAPSLVTPIKAVKNETEIKNMRDAYLKDCAALVQLFKWLKETVPHQPVTELDVDRKGFEFRARQPFFKGLSFETISAWGDHAAMMHYAPTPEKQYTLRPEGFYLIDSGSQFLNGTTDITRTVALGPLTAEQKRDFTLVLRAVISLSTAKFLRGTTGSGLDILARRPLWDEGLDYKCGSGHGVGYYSTVHEDPQRMSQKNNPWPLEPGMNLTIEPGVYKEGRHGIRTENTLLVTQGETTESGEFLRFETLTYLPIDRSAILPELLSPAERRWINDYHAAVYGKLSPLLDDEHRRWLKNETAPL